MRQNTFMIFIVTVLISFTSCLMDTKYGETKYPSIRCDTNLLKSISRSELAINHCDSQLKIYYGNILIVRSCDYVLSDSLASCFAKEIGSGFLDRIYNFRTGYIPLIYSQLHGLYTIDILFRADKKIKYTFDSLIKKQDTIYLYQKSLKNSPPSFALDFHLYRYEIKIDSNFNPIFIWGDVLE